MAYNYIVLSIKRWPAAGLVVMVLVIGMGYLKK